jgi:type IV secretion system protein VirB4
LSLRGAQMATNKQSGRGPISELHLELEPFGDFLLTKRGSLIGAIELTGRGPDGLSKEDYLALSLIARSIYQGFSEEISITQYYSHFDNPSISLQKREHLVSKLLSERRQEYLSEQKLTSSSIVHYFEIDPPEALGKLSVGPALKHLVLAAGNKQSREIVKNMLSGNRMIMCFLDDLERMQQELETTINDVVSKWGALMNCRQLPLAEVWGHCRFLSNLNPDLLTTGKHEPIPAERWDAVLSDGGRQAVTVANMDAMRLSGEENIYARILSVTRFGTGEVTPGIWAANPGSPVRQAHNYILMVRSKPISKFKQALMFSSKANELERQGLNVMSMLQGTGEQTAVEKKAAMKAGVREKLEELESAEMVDDRWWNSHGMAVVFNQNPRILKNTSIALKRSMDQCGFSACWETVDLPDAWRTFLPAGGTFSIRDMEFTTSQVAAASMLYRASEGQLTVSDLRGEEAQYIFASEDGTPFHFSPWVGGRCVVFGVGPIRSGKSFTKNTLACHFLKYGGLFRGIDVDQGCEPVAEAFGDDGGIFRVEEGNTKGFNPFVMAEGPEDMRFIAHLKNQILQMLETNDSEELRKLEVHEQSQLDHAIQATLRLPANLQRLSTVVNHAGKEFQTKLARWVNGGMYAHLFDQEHDAMGARDQKMVAFNLQGVKEDAIALPLVMTEVFSRVLRTFEDPRYRNVQKYLDIDEAHILLKIPYALNTLVRAIRTWGKMNAGVGLWTQSPQEFYNVPDWPALRSAASTFFFMADPHMDQGLYQKTFPLTAGECEAIRGLVPKREAYIVQPELGISKKVILDVEPEQYVISTSNPVEAEMRRLNRQTYGIEEGYRQTAIQLGLINEEREVLSA